MLTTRELSKQSGVSTARIREFIMLGWIKPHVPAKNRGGRNYFLQGSVIEARALKALVDLGMKRRAIEAIRKDGFLRLPHHRLRLVWDHESQP
jgi:DNA-binding transcriptional MerR regulator